MNLGFLSKDLSISRRKLAAAILLNSGTWAWFFLLFINISDIFKFVSLNDPFWVFYNIGPTLFFGSAVLFGILGSFLGLTIYGKKLLVLWISLGTFSTILLTLFQGTVFAVISCLLLGMSIGLGFPSIMALIADYTTIEERARVSGIIILGAFVLAFIASAVIRILNFGIIGTILVFAAVRSTSLLALVADKCNRQDQKAIEKNRSPIQNYREFGFYLFPWVMFAVAAGLAINLIPEQFADTIVSAQALRFVIIAVLGLASGVIADRFGRKIPIIAGLILLGANFALLGFFGITETNVFIYLISSGAAWGLFFVVFLAVPGDLSYLGSREKFYALGYILPISIFFGLSSIPGSNIFATSLRVSQILSLIVLLSIIPVLRAKETLSTQKIRDRKMKEYADKIEDLLQESKKKDDKKTD